MPQVLQKPSMVGNAKLDSIARKDPMSPNNVTQAHIVRQLVWKHQLRTVPMVITVFWRRQPLLQLMAQPETCAQAAATVRKAVRGLLIALREHM